MTEMTREQIVEARRVKFEKDFPAIAEGFVFNSNGMYLIPAGVELTSSVLNTHRRLCELWRAWSGGIESLEIELPPRRKTNHANNEANTEAHGFNDGVEACHDIFVAQGLKVKP